MNLRNRRHNRIRLGLVAAVLCAAGSAGAQFSYEVLHRFVVDGSGSEATLIQAADGYLYGTGNLGGENNFGVIYRADTSGHVTPLYSFTGGTDGFAPQAGLLQAADGEFYGTTSFGGAGGAGTVFKMDSTGTLTTLHGFSGSDGAVPEAELIEASGEFYGTTSEGGANDLGTVFRMDFVGNVTTLHSFASGEGAHPRKGLVHASDGAFYGTTMFGGANDLGTVFRMDSSGTITTLHSFAGAEGSFPRGSLIQAADGPLYGTASAGGADDDGTIFRIDLHGNLTVVASLTAAGRIPIGGLVQATDGKFYGTTLGGSVFGSVFRVDGAGHVTYLHAFAGDDGQGPLAGLVQASDGYLYGTTSGGGFNWGSLFRTDPAGSTTSLHVFGYSEGIGPTGLTRAADDDLYGAMYAGGGDNAGTVFRMDSAGVLETLHDFVAQESPSDGCYPAGSLIQGTDGHLYGTTDGCGANNGGTIFRLDTAGEFGVLYSFYGHPGDGLNPFGALVEAANGHLYGTTANGGTSGVGTVYEMDTSGSLAVLHSFANYPVDGAIPIGGLMQSNDGELYGTTLGGGAYGFGTAFRVDGSGQVATLHDFTVEEGNPSGGVVLQASDGLFYGTTTASNLGGNGTIFKMNGAGNVATLHRFGITDGANPSGGLVEAADGSFYGSTAQGGTGGDGTVFRMDEEGSVTPIHHGGSPSNSLVLGPDGSLYGTGSSSIYRLKPCAPSPSPVITVQACMPSDTAAFTASVVATVGDTYTWTLSGGTIESGQETNSIQFTSAAPGTLMDLSVLETNPAACSAATLVHIQVDFADAPPSDLFHDAVCAVTRHRISAGCGDGAFCSTSPVTRAQAAVLLLKAAHGPAYLPPPCAAVFSDVPCDSPYAIWIERLAAEGISAGCGGGHYCPDDSVTRAQAAPLLLRTRYGPAYAPPPADGLFDDVPPTGFAADWIEDLYRKAITGGCSGTPLLYCPGASVTRGQWATLLTRAFGLD